MSDRLLVATRKGLFDLRRQGAAWKTAPPSFLGVPVTLTLRDPRDGSLYAALDHGHFGVKLQRSDDDGASWTEVAAPAYPELPEGAEPEKDSAGRPWPWTLKLIWSLAVDPREEGALWCGTIPGGLFHSADRGATWQLDEGLWRMDARRKWIGGGMSLPGIHSILVDPRDAAQVTLGVSCGGIWRSEDGGASWNSHARGMRAEYMPEDRAFEETAQDPHCVVQCREHPDRMWVQHHNGIFRSDDAGRSWSEIEDVQPSGFGFAVAVHPHQPDTAWFVPGVKDECRVPVDGRLIVNHTTDGGKSFEPITEGLPAGPAYDIVLRHALDVDAAGESLAFGSTTGSLWHGDRGGSRWSLIQPHLPPIYAVRFA